MPCHWCGTECWKLWTNRTKRSCHTLHTVLTWHPVTTIFSDQWHKCQEDRSFSSDAEARSAVLQWLRQQTESLFALGMTKLDRWESWDRYFNALGGLKIKKIQKINITTSTWRSRSMCVHMAHFYLFWGCSWLTYKLSPEVHVGVP